MEAANYNWGVLSGYKDLGECIAAQKESIVGYGSEFRKAEVLEPLFRHHPLWPRMQKALTQGVTFPLKEISQRDMAADVKEALAFGNHKGCVKHKSFLEDCIEDDVTHGFSLVFPKDQVKDIPGALVAPLNVHDQNTINERGEVIDKKRLTHNLSKVFGGSGESVNSRLFRNEIQECMYGYCILRLVHLIVALRTRFPDKKIFLTKWDWKSAYL